MNSLALADQKVLISNIKGKTLAICDLEIISENKGDSLNNI